MVEHLLAANDEAAITAFIRKSHETGDFLAGRACGKQFLAQNGWHWKEASSEFLDHFSICCYYAGEVRQSFEVTSYLLDYRSLSDSDRRRIDFNRHFSIPQVKDDFIEYPAQVVQQIMARPAAAKPQITFSITTCKRTDLFVRTMNSFLQCCQDIDLIDEWLCVDDNTHPDERATMQYLFPFFRFIWKGPDEKGHARSMNLILQNARTPYLFHCEDDWQFFSPKPFLSEALEILQAEADIGQVLVNRNYAEETNGHEIVGGVQKRTEGGIQYIEHEYYAPDSQKMEQFSAWNPGPHCAYWPHFSLRPSLMRLEAWERTGEFNENAAHFEMEYAHRYLAAGYRSCFFNTVYCLHTGRLTRQRQAQNLLNAYALNQQEQFGEPRAARSSPRIKPLTWWASSRELCEILNIQSQGDYRWNDLQLTWQDDADYFVIFQSPRQGKHFLPERSIVFQTEPLAKQHPEIWGERWADPRPGDFLQVRRWKDFPNCPEWHLGLSYGELHRGPSPEKTKLFSAIISARYVDPGQIKRVDFLKYYERQAQMPPVDIYGYNNEQGFGSYRGALPERQKAGGLIPYRYTFNAENHMIPNYFSEKIIDAILAETLCFYWGCPNLEELIDPQAFIRLDLDDPDRAVQMIRAAIENDEWSKRLPAIREQKKRILAGMHFFPVMENILKEVSLPAFVINLDRRPDRWRAQRDRLQSHWRNFTRYAALDGRSIQLNEAQKRIFAGNDFGSRRTFIACALSHMGLWLQLAEDACHTKYLVLEDDVEFCQNFGERLREVERKVKGRPWDIIFLGAHIWRDRRETRLYERNASFVNLTPNPPAHMLGGTFAYLISKRGAEKLLRLAETEGVQNGIDAWIMRRFDRLQVYFVEPHLAFSEYVFPDGLVENVDTDIQNDFLPIEWSSE